MTLPLRIELAITFKAVFPDVLARDRSGHGHPGASEAVSGCNILILPLDASFLRAFRGGFAMAENDRFAPMRPSVKARRSGEASCGRPSRRHSEGGEGVLIAQPSIHGKGFSSAWAANDRLITM